MCKSNLKPEIKQTVINIKTKSMSKLLEAAIVAEDCHKELEHKYKSKRIQTSTPSASKGKKKEDVFIIQTLKTPRKAQDPKDEAARKEEYERRKNVIQFFDHISRATHCTKKKNIVKDVFATRLHQKIEGFKVAILDSFAHCEKEDSDSKSNIESLNLMELPVKNKESTSVSLKDGEKAIKQPIKRKARRVSGLSARQLNNEGEEVDAYNPTLTASRRTQFTSPQNPAIQDVLNAPKELSSMEDATNVEAVIQDTLSHFFSNDVTMMIGFSLMLARMRSKS
ncbi:hypothetical protein MRB53_026737 [Persea americana]|uniref:Uncharacterized protein n=1 Tax=Persea americana TaxID=3435 RepID=A0ACC2LIW3_PERAE|nr:hypothetical protein MRB53_026737 [Persea americana]